MMEAVRVAYTLEQCWHRVPGGTARAALEIARHMPAGEVELVGVAGWHRRPPAPEWSPPCKIRRLLPHGPLLYESWLALRWPPVEAATGRVDVAHATTIIPCPTKAPLVVTIHDLAFLHDPQHFTARGNRVFRTSLDLAKRQAALVLCSSIATMAECAVAGFDEDRLRHVPLGVDAVSATAAQRQAVREAYRLPESFALFVGTIEPRKNLERLSAAIRRAHPDLPLVVAGADGWGRVRADERTRFLGFVPSADLAALYAAATVFCYPSLREGYGLPVVEAMAQGTPVVTSRGTATEEAAGGAAVLVDPLDIDDIANGIGVAIADRERLRAAGLARAAAVTWDAAAAATVACYREVCR